MFPLSSPFQGSRGFPGEKVPKLVFVFEIYSSLITKTKITSIIAEGSNSSIVPYRKSELCKINKAYKK